jgi:SAM-dependent methyltransferase
MTNDPFLPKAQSQQSDLTSPSVADRAAPPRVQIDATTPASAPPGFSSPTADPLDAARTISPKFDVPHDFAGVHRTTALDPDAAEPCADTSCSAGQFFESIYECADGDPTRVPWADCRPNPVLLAWLNREACHLVRPGSRAVVVGCGLGDDLVELTRRGYDAMGFDVSPTAIRWAARRHPQMSDRFLQADLLDLPARLVGRFDLVVEISTIQSVHPGLRRLVASGIGRLVAPRGAVMTLARGRPDSEELDPRDGPPWPLTKGELLALMSNAGLCPHGDVCEVCDLRGGDAEQAPGRHWLLGTFVRC